jgi:hypothetical protein
MVDQGLLMTAVVGFGVYAGREVCAVDHGLMMARWGDGVVRRFW